MNATTIQITLKSVYGVETAYPVCERAKLFAEIAGSKTLTHRTLCLIERMGFEIEVVANTGRLVLNRAA
jgi:hypothetical protein